MLQEPCKARRESIGLLYVDATQAFYAVLRSLVVAVTESDEAVAFLFAQLKLPTSALDELRTILAQGPCLNHSAIDQATNKKHSVHFFSMPLRREKLFPVWGSEQRHQTRTSLRRCCFLLRFPQNPGEHSSGFGQHRIPTPCNHSPI